MPLDVDTARGRETRIARFFDFDHPESGLNEFVVTTQFRARRGNERGGPEDDERAVIPDLVLFVNGVPLVVMEAKSPSMLDVWKSKAVRQLRRYQEAGPEWHGAGAPELFDYNLLCVAHCGAAAVFAALGAPENAYVEWKSLLPYSEDEARGPSHCWGLMALPASAMDTYLRMRVAPVASSTSTSAPPMLTSQNTGDSLSLPLG